MTETTGSMNSKFVSVRCCNVGHLSSFFPFLEPKLFMSFMCYTQNNVHVIVFVTQTILPTACP